MNDQEYLKIANEKEKNMERYWVTLAGIFIYRDKCLILEFKDYPGFWDIPGGRIEKNEDYLLAFNREIYEEIGLESITVIDLVDYDIWYTKRRKMPVCAIAHLIDAPNPEIKISDEHQNYKWIEENELDNYEFLWPEAKRMIRKGFEKYRLKNDLK